MTPVLLRTTLLILLVAFSFNIPSAQQQISVGTFVQDPVTGKSYRAYDESFALIVGIDGYTQVEARRSSASSAKGVKELLMSRFGFREENIILLLNEQARRTIILDGLKKFQRRGPNDRVLIFFSGRGYTGRDQAGAEHGFFIPFDGQVDPPSAVPSTCISIDELKKSVTADGSKHALVLLDFAVGGLPVVKQFSGVPPARLGFQQIVTSPAKEILAAGGRSETADDDASTGMSIFTSKLIETLSSATADANNDGIIIGTELASQTAVKMNASSERKAHAQFGFFDGGQGDFLFILPHTADTSHVSFTLDPRDAAVFIDNKQIKSSIIDVPVVSPRVGLHSFQVQRDGFKTLKEDFFVNGRISVKADVTLEKLPSTGLLVKVSVPDAKIYIDGKFVGMPEQSLLLENIGNGKHSVRAELEGYFMDSASVTIEKPIQYTVTMKLKSRNGFLTVRSSEAVVITVNGKELGTERVMKKEVLPGTYSVMFSGIGYDKYEEKVIVRDTESVEFIHPMKRPTLGGALWRSAVFPGWGQSYSGRHGIVYSGIFALLAGSSAGLQLTYTQTNKDYTKYLNLANTAILQTDIDKYKKKVLDLNTKRKNYNLYRFGAFGLTGAFYLYNIINVWRNDPADLIRDEEAKAKKEKLNPRVSLGYNQFGPALFLSVQL